MSVPCWPHAVKPGVMCQSVLSLQEARVLSPVGFVPVQPEGPSPELYRTHLRFMLVTRFVCSADVRLTYCREQMNAAKVRCSHVVAFN